MIDLQKLADGISNNADLLRHKHGFKNDAFNDILELCAYVYEETKKEYEKEINQIERVHESEKKRNRIFKTLFFS